jgi:hypothetical protein
VSSFVEAPAVQLVQFHVPQTFFVESQLVQLKLLQNMSVVSAPSDIAVQFHLSQTLPFQVVQFNCPLQ